MEGLLHGMFFRLFFLHFLPQFRNFVFCLQSLQVAETIDLDFDEYDDFESVRLPGVEHNISLEQSNEKVGLTINFFMGFY